jgi:hypothetical protein
MGLKVGRYVWVPCEVKPGPFSDERMVRVHSQFGNWLGFVPASSLKDPILEGETLVPALIVDITDGSFLAKLPGEAVTNTLYAGSISKVQPVDTLQT